MRSSVQEIRTRLFLLLVRTFVIVLFLSVFFFLAIVSFVLTSPSASSAPFSMPFIGALQGYYLGHGGWDGVEVVFNSNDELKSLSTILLDKDQRILLDRDAGSDWTFDSTYEIRPDDLVLPIDVNGQKIGSLVITSLSVPARLDIVRGIIFPVGVISFVLALFLVVVAILLVRRFVNPLADVIYAARKVASGKLSTRIASTGPQDLRSLSESFNEMASSLERSDRERRNMLADIAHELRTPLSVIRWRLEGIVDGVYSADGSQVSLALEQAYLLERLVDDLRLLTLAETRQLHFEKKSVDLGELAQRAIDLFSAEAREKNISLSLENESSNLHVELDPQRTEQVIGNLIGNALRYVPEGGKVWLNLEEMPESVCITVNDNGLGVAQEDLPFLFDRFWRKDKSRSRSSGGTGLGLAIARQLIEAQGGKIFANNIPGGGLQVVVEFSI